MFKESHDLVKEKIYALSYCTFEYKQKCCEFKKKFAMPFTECVALAHKKYGAYALCKTYFFSKPF